MHGLPSVGLHVIFDKLAALARGRLVFRLGTVRLAWLTEQATGAGVLSSTSLMIHRMNRRLTASATHPTAPPTRAPAGP
jgi:hypothetical protein